jgi:hypothetical protein
MCGYREMVEGESVRSQAELCDSLAALSLHAAAII